MNAAVSVIPEQQLSPARAALAALFTEKTTIEDRLRHLAERAKPFRDIEAAAKIAAERLSGLNASEAAAMAAWSSGETDVAPAFDKARAALETDLERASARADSALSISATVDENIGRLSQRQRQVLRTIELAKVQVLIEVVHPIIDRLEISMAEGNRLKVEATKAVDFIAQTSRDLGRLGMPDADIAGVRPLLQAVEKLNERINGVIGDVRWSYRYASDARWPALLATLSHDPLAEPEVS
jgi:hypothetical protein